MLQPQHLLLHLWLRLQLEEIRVACCRCSKRLTAVRAGTYTESGILMSGGGVRWYGLMKRHEVDSGRCCCLHPGCTGRLVFVPKTGCVQFFGDL
jgi:hypothetical protein